MCTVIEKGIQRKMVWTEEGGESQFDIGIDTLYIPGQSTCTVLGLTQHHTQTCHMHKTHTHTHLLHHHVCCDQSLPTSKEPPKRALRAGRHCGHPGERIVLQKAWDCRWEQLRGRRGEGKE